MKTGRCTYIIEFPRGKYYFHKALVHFRTEPIFSKIIEGQQDVDDNVNEPIIVKNKIFKKHLSVFEKMDEDNKRKIDACIDHDIKNLGL